jgi:hypothetical protein
VNDDDDDDNDDSERAAESTRRRGVRLRLRPAAGAESRGVVDYDDGSVCARFGGIGVSRRCTSLARRPFTRR